MMPPTAHSLWKLVFGPNYADENGKNRDVWLNASRCLISSRSISEQFTVDDIERCPNEL